MIEAVSAEFHTSNPVLFCGIALACLALTIAGRPASVVPYLIAVPILLLMIRCYLSSIGFGTLGTSAIFFAASLGFAAWWLRSSAYRPLAVAFGTLAAAGALFPTALLLRWAVRRRLDRARSVLDHPFGGVAAAFSDRLLRVADEEGILEWAPGGAVETRAEPRAAAGHPAALSPDGRLLAVGLAEGVRIWDLDRNQAVRDLPGRADAVAIGRVLATTAPDVLRIWDLASGDRLAEIPGHRHENPGLAMSGDGAWLALGCYIDRSIRLIELAERRMHPPIRIDEADPTALALNPDGSILAVAVERGVLLCDPRTGREIRRFRGRADVLAFSPDGTKLAASDRIWDVASGKLLRSISLHPLNVRAVAFSPDGRWVATCSVKRTIVQEIGP